MASTGSTEDVALGAANVPNLHIEETVQASNGDELRTELTLRTSDGMDLQAEYVASGEARASAVVCHPHPRLGGSMRANVVEALFRGLPPEQVSVLRFNFRGTDRSEGEHDNGRAERLDVLAAIEEAERRLPGSPLLLAGYSFGADVALATDHEAITGWLAVAPPLRVVSIDEMVAIGDERPKHVICGANDQFRSPSDVAEAIGHAANLTLTTVEGADHFFSVGLSQVVDAALAVLAPTLQHDVNRQQSTSSEPH